MGEAATGYGIGVRDGGVGECGYKDVANTQKTGPI